MHHQTVFISEFSCALYSSVACVCVVVEINDTYFRVNPVIMHVVSVYLELKEIMLMVFCIIAPPK